MPNFSVAFSVVSPHDHARRYRRELHPPGGGIYPTDINSGIAHAGIGRKVTVGWVSALSQGHGDHKDHFAALKANCDLVTNVMALVQRFLLPCCGGLATLCRHPLAHRWE